MTAHPNRSRKTPSPAASPAPAAIRRARERAGLTQTEAAALVHSTCRRWQQWEAEREAISYNGRTENARMHPGLWELFRIKLDAQR
jgi:DNA-binding transcriptional regulator YiaG